ncbi:TadE/TadG family type IV pilus assembly protein [Sphingomonas sp. 1P08PE]|uniref:TadE/TadG family type IV pilus assembly protein n=1 Tax=Sphingomonas sp. 1P08PE TaxID=554122 RepID=UPI0039A37235
MLMRKLAPFARRLWRDRRGNMLMIFAFSVLPITFATGMGIDYAAAMRLQTRLNAVTDAAALSAVTSPMMKEGMDDACAAARSTFESQAANITGLTINTKVLTGLTITITDTLATGGPVTVICPAVGAPTNIPSALPLSRTAAVTYTARSANSFAGILGRDTLGIGGTATSKTTLAPYIDIHMALDTSQSMGLAASNADADALWDKTRLANGDSKGCTFGCHVFQDAEADSPNVKNKWYASNEFIANYYGIRLRIDTLRDATQDMLQTAIDGQNGNKYYQFALYRIGASTTDYATLTDNLSNLKSQVQSLTLGPNDSSGFGDTNLADMLATTYDKIKVKGDGTTKAKARAFLFIVTDGVSDVKGGGCVYSHCMATVDPTKCQRYKDAGITVGVVYTTYLPVKSNPKAKVGDKDYNSLRDEYTKLVQPLAGDIRPNLEKCSTPGWFFEASDGPGIHSAMQNLFRQATQTPTIIR